MLDYIFTLTYRCADTADDIDECVGRLMTAGCDDALIGVGVAGRIALDFTRSANNAREAMVSALADVKAAMPAACLIEAAPDLVGLTDVAALTRMTRQNMRKLMLAADAFPSPVHEGSVVIWHLAEVLAWLVARGGYRIDQSLFDVAKAAMLINFANRSRRQMADIPADIWSLVA